MPPEMQLGKPSRIVFQFKGQREYVHGTDLYTQLLEVAQQKFGPHTWLSKLVIRKVFQNNCLIYFNTYPTDKSPCAHFETINQDGPISGFVIDSLKKVSERDIHFSLANLIQDAVYTDRSIILLKTKESKIIDIIVGSTKYLHLHLFKPETGQWMFTSLNLAEPLKENSKKITITITQNLAGKMTTSNILLNDKFVGKITFTLVKNKHVPQK